MEEKKICKIINAQFSWILEVNGFSIAFQGLISAGYFYGHYKNLGYQVELIGTEYDFSEGEENE